MPIYTRGCSYISKLEKSCQDWMSLVKSNVDWSIIYYMPVVEPLKSVPRATGMSEKVNNKFIEHWMSLYWGSQIKKWSVKTNVTVISCIRHLYHIFSDIIFFTAETTRHIKRQYWIQQFLPWLQWCQPLERLSGLQTLWKSSYLHQLPSWPIGYLFPVSEGNNFILMKIIEGYLLAGFKCLCGINRCAYVERTILLCFCCQ